MHTDVNQQTTHHKQRTDGTSRLRPRFPAAVSLLALLFLLAANLPAQAASRLELVKVADGFSTPVFVTHAGDGSGRLFVVEKGGVIRIIKNGEVLRTPFLDISSRVANQGEAGLLSVAFPENYEQDGYFFVYYNHVGDLVPPEPSDGGRNGGFDTVVARFQVTSNPDVADPDSEERIFTRNQPYQNHNGGLIAFGPDGKLYIGLGDGGSGGDPQNQAQTLSSTLGKLLRVEVGATGTYTIPADNPLANSTTAKREIWHWGLRNPWRWSFDRSTGDLWIADVGQNAFEEVNFVAEGEGGLNFGWRCKEAFEDFDTDPPCTGTLTDPVASYSHSIGNSITGGYRYRGDAFPQLQGTYLFADFVTGRIWSMTRGSGSWNDPQEELDTNLSISSFGEDEEGELYVVDFGGGNVYRLTATIEGLRDQLYLPAVQNKAAAGAAGD
jgi:glucose/arabinose dehydrogenase